VILAQLSTISHAPLAMFLQDSGGTVNFSFLGLWGNMGWMARGVVGVLFIMSIWSLAVIIDRALYFRAARAQSREFAPKVAGALKDGRLDERSSWATAARSRTWRRLSPPDCRSSAASVQAARSRWSRWRARSGRSNGREAIVHAKLKRGLGGLATIGSTAPFIRSVRHRGRHSERLPADCDAEDLGHRRGGRRYLGGAGNDGVRAAGGDPPRL